MRDVSAAYSKVYCAGGNEQELISVKVGPWFSVVLSVTEAGALAAALDNALWKTEANA